MTSYDQLLAEARDLFPGVRIGRPGRSRGYWPTLAVLRVLRLRWRVDVQGAEQVRPGPGILIANHVQALDPVMVVMSLWWQVSAFAKVELFQGKGAVFFRLMGQIPLRRGDPAATAWAMRMASCVLADGTKIAIYPEGKRSPDPTKLHRLHKRMLVPLLQSHPDVPVHAVTTRYARNRWWRTDIELRVSDPLALDDCRSDPEALTDAVRQALLELGGQAYVDVYARDVVRDRG